MPIDINHLTQAELIQLNHKIVTCIEQLQQSEVTEARRQFTIGSLAGFVDGSGDVINCIINKFNKKTVTVTTLDGLRWNVPADRLRNNSAIRVV